jgi:glycosyltransferase involved in cell wall biosynthesis
MAHYPPSKKWIVYVSTFPPRECGIATFTQDLMNSFDEMYKPREEAKVVAMNPDETSQYVYDQSKVIYQIPRDNQEHYEAAATYLNSLEEVSLVHVQHEFGIFGGSYGRHIVLLLRTLHKPAIVTFHTVLPSPTSEMNDVVNAINNHVQKIIVMTEGAKHLLISEYAINPEKIVVIPHGIHPVSFSDGEKERRELALTNHVVISTFGLIGKNKGIEYGIAAMAEVVKQHPTAMYLIIGATHPTLLKEEGEAYRNSLTQKVRELGLEKHILFYDKYLGLAELLRFLSATHIYLALSQDPYQAVSGTLSYALGTGRAVVSTAFPQAKEDVTEDVGILVDFKSADGITAALLSLVGNEQVRLMMGKNAYVKTRGRTWRNVMLRHMHEYIRLVPALAQKEKNLPPIKLSHITDLTDNFGMIQFAQLLLPDPSSGYTIDDNARALVSMVKYYELFKKNTTLPLIDVYLAFIEYVQKEDGGFHNYVDKEKHIKDSQHTRENLESAGTRGMYALAITAVSGALPKTIRKRASELFVRHLPLLYEVTSPRSIAYAIKTLCTWHTAYPLDGIHDSVTRLAGVLVSLFEENSTAEWKWFEDILAYSNGTLPHALIDAYRLTHNEKYLSVARQALDFLVQNSFEETICVPIGQKGWLRRGGRKHLHDQQPEEVTALVSCLKAMHAITRDEKYAQRMRNAFDWFLGNNMLQRVVYDQASGGCYDGLGEADINLNQGAESTIMYLLARLEFEQQS